MSVVIETTIGDITIDLFIEQRPNCCKNFLKLCKIKYFNGCTFHFIERDFIAQTGDPTNSGHGGQSVYSLLKNNNDTSEDDNQKNKFIEMEKKPKIKHDRFGLVSMVNNGENLHGSQFFFTLSDQLNYLDGIHTVFAEVVEGLEVLIKLNDQICDEKHRPYQDIMITHTVILDDPFPEIPGLEIPSMSPPIDLQKLIESDRIGIGEDVVDQDKDPEEIEEELKDKEAKQRALVLEMIGDIPDAEIRPPENVLFICKLNPVTREEDLEIIFSRFGKILSCEIIKDDKTGESLQYGFIEFDKKEDCEKAYFKMDNVLIDDRRIHVDFSQSVSKIKWRGKGRGTTFIDPDDPDASKSNNSSKSLKYIESLKGRDERKNEHRQQPQQSKRKDHDNHYHQNDYRQDRNHHHHQRDNYRSSHDSHDHHDRHRSRKSQREEQEPKEKGRSSRSKDYHHHQHRHRDDYNSDNKKRRSNHHHS